ncbi:MAG: hypothetical protein GYA33_01180 [Thermogutta sp.]|nr:hypothetical protein [Thermogutta sp.]
MPISKRLMFGIVALVCAGTAAPAWAGDAEGGAADWTGWSFQNATLVPKDDADEPPALLCENSRALAIRTFVAWPNTPFHATVRIRTEDVQPTAGGGFAYAAVYEFDETGNLTAFRDFAEMTGTHEWIELETQGKTHERTFSVELRLGLYQAAGKAWFEPARLTWVTDSNAKSGDRKPLGFPSVALILDEPEFPRNFAAPDSRAMADLLAEAGYQARFIRAEDLASAGAWEKATADAALLVLPNGPCFPIEARQGLLALLCQGVDLLSFGGYPFDAPLRHTERGWESVDLTQPTSVKLLNRDPGFETDPESGRPAVWHDATGNPCPTATAETVEGSRCAQVRQQDGEGRSYTQTVADVKAGQWLRLSGRVKTEDVQGAGYAFLAYYPMAGDEWRSPRDIAQVRDTRDWQSFTQDFRVPPGVDRVEIRFGLYRASGTAYFDDIRLEEVEYAPRLNTRYGLPKDGLLVSPWQLGMCDADYPLRRTARLTAPGWEAAVAAEGFSTVGVLNGNTRWIPLVAAEDRFGRQCGTAGAMMVQATGQFAGSTWTFFGVNNADLTQLPRFRERVLRPALSRMRRGIFLDRAQSRLACYRPGEPAEISCSVRHLGPQTFSGSLTWRRSAEDSAAMLEEGRREVRLTTGEAAVWTIPLKSAAVPSGLHRVTVRLQDASGDICDELSAGFVVWDGKDFPRGTRFGYADNYFRLDDRPAFLCGTTTWSNWFVSPSQSDPLFWAEELGRMADYGIRVNANLQTWWRPPYELSEEDWRKLDAAVYLSHRAGVIHRAGLFIGHDVAVDDALLERQAQFAAAFAARYRHAEGLIYYLNGDYHLQPKSPEQQDMAWQLAQTRHWNERLTEALRSADPCHPIISEYYQIPMGGLDVRQTLDGLDMAEIGYFDTPDRDLSRFPAVFKMTDHRLRGKSAAIGEFGAKTHPAWEPSLGGGGYHMRRSVEQQNRLFLTLPQLTFGLGGAAARNWCWRDDDDRIFPWGLTYTCDGVPREALRFYRAAALLLLRLQPRWKQPEVVLVASDSTRRTVSDGFSPYDLAAADMLARLGVDFAVVSDLDLREGDLRNVKAAFVPGETVSNGAAQILDALKQGGSLMVCREHPAIAASPATEKPESAFVPSPELLRRWAELLDRAGVARVRIQPDDPAVAVMPVALQDGAAVVLVNTGDQMRRLQATSPDGKSVEMSLAPWEPGLAAWDSAGRVLALEGGSALRCDGRPVAESDGHLLLWSVETQIDRDDDIRTAREIFLVPTTARNVHLMRAQNGSDTAELGEFRHGSWHGLTEMSLQSTEGGVRLQVPGDCQGELIRIRRR